MFWVDLALFGDCCGVLIKVECNPTTEQVEQHLQHIAKFKSVLPRYADLKVMGAIAAMVIPNEVRDYAYYNDLFVLAPAGDYVAVLNPHDFQPQCW